MSWTRKVAHPNEIVNKGDSVRALVLAVDQEKKRVALGVKQLEADPWRDDIPMRYGIGTVIDGTVTKITNFGVFVELEKDLEGLLHVSELTTQKDQKPEDVVKIGDKVKVKVLRVDPEERKIGLTLLNEQGQPATPAGPEEDEDLSRDRKPKAAKKK
jgi:small subunit ribosomal protein S1